MKKLLLIMCVVFFSVNAFALGNNNNCNTNGQSQGQDQIQGQAQGQNQTSINANKNVNKTANINGNLNANKLDNQNNQNIVFEDVREYVQPTQISLPNGVTGYNERIQKGRRFISIDAQIRFSKTWSVDRAKKMLQSNSFGVKVTLTRMVDSGDYTKTEGITICNGMNSLPEGKYVEIGIVTGRSMRKSNSAMITAKFIVQGSKLGADYLVLFDENTDRRFKHRGIGGGGGGADATNSPDTVLSGLLSFHSGSNRYEEYPFLKGYLLRTVE